MADRPHAGTLRDGLQRSGPPETLTEIPAIKSDDSLSRSESKQPAPGRPASRRFATTQWSVVAAAGRRSSPQSRAALAALCGSYWYPLYALVRSQGYTADDAQDLTQEFFVRLLRRNDFAAADRTKGR